MQYISDNAVFPLNFHSGRHRCSCFTARLILETVFEFLPLELQLKWKDNTKQQTGVGGIKVAHNWIRSAFVQIR